MRVHVRLVDKGSNKILDGAEIEWEVVEGNLKVYVDGHIVLEVCEGRWDYILKVDTDQISPSA